MARRTLDEVTLAGEDLVEQRSAGATGSRRAMGSGGRRLEGATVAGVVGVVGRTEDASLLVKNLGPWWFSTAWAAGTLTTSSNRLTT
jgi:hypothetical protein